MIKEEAWENYGRMLEACDIEMAIESGQFKTLRDVLDAVRTRSESINKTLQQSGFFKEGKLLNSKDCEERRALYEAEQSGNIRH